MVPVLTLLALSVMSTCNVYSPSVSALTVGSSLVFVVKVIVPVPAVCDRTYHATPARASVPVTLITVPVLVTIPDHISIVGRVLSI